MMSTTARHRLQGGPVKAYVLGFMFDEEGKHVVLIEKTRPEWQAGKLNGVGGKVEPGEGPLEAMIREFQEETGLYHVLWQPFVHLVGKHQDGSPWEIYIYRTWSRLAHNARTLTEERVTLLNVEDFLAMAKHTECVRNLRWMIPMAMDQHVCGHNDRFIHMYDRSGF